ncbi:MAG: protein-methionine-sulfoxide reductase heme-binding subunit MsrQ [Gemmatimonadota bacterium]
MTGAQWVTRVLKPVTWVACLGPAVWLLAATWVTLHGPTGPLDWDLGVDPVKTLQHTTGLSALVMLLVTLTVTPFRRLTGWNPIIKVRRLLGLFAFFYALSHLLIYAVFDQELSLTKIAADIVKHPWVLVGFAAFLILLTLALTSPAAAVRKLGGKRWQSLHRLIYAAGLLGVLHFLWLVKKDESEPLTYGAVFLVLMAVRLIPRRSRRAGELKEGLGLKSRA